MGWAASAELYLLWYSLVMAVKKRKVSVSLDADLVHELQAADQAVSQQVNEAVREMLVKRRRHHMLTQLLDQLSERHGPVPTNLIEKYTDLLG